MPSLIKPLLGNPLADAVVLPISEAEIGDLVIWASWERLPFMPRGKAAIGCGDTLPFLGSNALTYPGSQKCLPQQWLHCVRTFTTCTGHTRTGTTLVAAHSGNRR